MATFSKQLLSGSTQGMPVKVVAVATAGTTLHTTGISAAVFDEVWLYGQNNHTADVLVTLEFGDATAPDHNIIFTLPAKSGLTLLVPGLVLVGTGAAGATVKAFAATANVISIVGYVNRIT